MLSQALNLHSFSATYARRSLPILSTYTVNTAVNSFRAGLLLDHLPDLHDLHDLVGFASFFDLVGFASIFGALLGLGGVALLGHILWRFFGFVGVHVRLLVLRDHIMTLKEKQLFLVLYVSLER